MVNCASNGAFCLDLNKSVAYILRNSGTIIVETL